MSARFETSPSLTPNTPARSVPLFPPRCQRSANLEWNGCPDRTASRVEAAKPTGSYVADLHCTTTAVTIPNIPFGLST